VTTETTVTEDLTPDIAGVPILSVARVEDVFAAAEELRAADFPNIPAQLLADILAAEHDNIVNRIAAARAVGRAVDAYLGSAGEAEDAGGSA
jgi:hypothetical protein